VPCGVVETKRECHTLGGLPLTAETGVRLQSSPCGVDGGYSDAGTYVFWSRTFVSSCQWPFHSYSVFICLSPGEWEAVVQRIVSQRHICDSEVGEWVPHNELRGPSCLEAEIKFTVRCAHYEQTRNFAQNYTRTWNVYVCLARHFYVCQGNHFLGYPPCTVPNSIIIIIISIGHTVPQLDPKFSGPPGDPDYRIPVYRGSVIRIWCILYSPLNYCFQTSGRQAFRIAYYPFDA